MKALRIDVYSHHLVLTQFTEVCQTAIKRYIYAFLALYERVPKGYGQSEYRLSKLYASYNRERLEYRLHRNCLNTLVEFLKNQRMAANDIDIVHHSVIPGDFVDFQIRKDFVPYDYQADTLENYLNKPEPIAKLLTFQTGFGKTLTAQASMTFWKTRTLVLLKPMFIEKWMEDFKKDLGLTAKDIVVIQGSSALAGIIQQAQEGVLDKKVIILSNRTHYFYIHHYKTMPKFEFDDMYGCAPQDLIQTLGIGLRLIDETHMEFHGNFIMDLYTHVGVSIDMSATLDSEEVFMKKMYELRFPVAQRYSAMDYSKYVDVIAIRYWFREESLNKIRFIRRGRQSYSHVDFEKSLMRYRKSLDRYVKMVQEIIEAQYLLDREPGQKMLVFAATVSMCTHLRDALKITYPHLKIGRYVSEDSFDVLTDNDIIVSTLLSSGTAVDIAGLRTVLMTTAVKSLQQNVQALGRLRRLKAPWDKVPLRFTYLVSENIQAHLDYHEAKRRVFKYRCGSFNEIYIRSQI